MGERLKDAAKWVPAYAKRLVVKKYLKKYGVSLKDCVKELAMLGRPDPRGDLRHYNQWKAEKREARRARQDRAREQQAPPEPPFNPCNWDPRKKKAVRRLGELRQVRWAKEARAILDADYSDEIPF